MIKEKCFGTRFEFYIISELKYADFYFSEFPVWLPSFLSPVEKRFSCLGDDLNFEESIGVVKPEGY